MFQYDFLGGASFLVNYHRCLELPFFIPYRVNIILECAIQRWMIVDYIRFTLITGILNILSLP